MKLKRMGVDKCSPMARTLMHNFVTLTAASIVLTVLSMARLSRDQVAWTVSTLRKTDQYIVTHASQGFTKLGRAAVHSSVQQAGSLSLTAVKQSTDTLSKAQTQSFSRAASEFSNLSAHALESSLKQSLDTQNQLLQTSQVQQSRLLHTFVNNIQGKADSIARNAMLGLNREVVRGRALALADRLEERMRSAPFYLKFTAQMLNMSSSDSVARKVTLDALLRRVPEFRTVAVLNTHGQEINKTAIDYFVQPSNLKNRASAPWFKKALDGGIWLNLSHTRDDNGEPMLRIAVPIVAFAGRNTGVLAATYSLDEIWEAIAETHIGSSGFALVQNSSGRPLLQSRVIPPDALTASVVLQPLGWKVVAVVPRAEAMMPIEKMHYAMANMSQQARHALMSVVAQQAAHATGQLRQKLGAIQMHARSTMHTRASAMLAGMAHKENRQTHLLAVNLQNRLRSLSRQSIQNTQKQMDAAAVSAAQTLTHSLQPVAKKALQHASRRLTLMALVIIALACCATGIAAHFTARNFVRPVQQLSSAAIDIAQGQLERRVEEGGPEELVELGRAFNLMCSSLQQSQSDLQQTEAQLVQSAKLASLGTLSAGVAHELNQPIAIIRGIAQQVLQEPEIPGEMREDLELIVDQTGRMVKIVKHLRTFCRTGGTDFTAVDLNQAIEECFILVGAQLKAHNVEVELNLCPQTPQVMGDRNELEQVFINLITNARDALEGRTDAKISITSSMTGGYAYVEFHDNGPGIPEEVLNRIFDPFFTTKEAGKGTGLGLSISHNILKKHLAEITVFNNQGAQFNLKIPLAETAEIINQKVA